MDMREFADFLSFREQTEEAFDSYNLDAATMTIDCIDKNDRCVVGRVVWKSPLVKFGKQKSHDALHFTLMDATGVEITGTVWAAAALAFDKLLEVNSIYKFTMAVPICKTDKSYYSRLVYQNRELRFSGMCPPEKVRQEPFPNIDHSGFTVDYENIRIDEIVNIVGIVANVTGQEVVLTNGGAICVRVKLNEEKLEEFVGKRLHKIGTIVGFFGAKKAMDDKSSNLGPFWPRARFTSFDDTIIIPQPDCDAAKNLKTWSNQLIITQEVEDIY